MGKKDYTKFTNTNKIEEKVEEVTDFITEEIIESNTEKSKTGIVANCTRLNVRKQPSITSDALCTISNGTKVMIEESQSTEEFYKVCTEIGEEGFCMKKYIEI